MKTELFGQNKILERHLQPVLEAMQAYEASPSDPAALVASDEITRLARKIFNGVLFGLGSGRDYGFRMDLEDGRYVSVVVADPRPAEARRRQA